ncbi:MAG TPA: hypothetical protein PLM09_10910 [Casimicrobiaceae bacterium]|nr:hypothetical protein [Casimicrobiaceae bacterium]
MGASIRKHPSTAFYLAVVPPCLLTADLVYENTALSWSAGPQMIGFSLMHTVGIILFPLVLASIVWCALTVLLPLHTRRWNLGNIGGALLILLMLAIASLPYGFWVGLFAERISKGPHAAEFLVHMAALGEQEAVEALLKHGVPVNASNRAGLRAVEAATNAQQESVRVFLESKGGTDKRF